MIMRTWDNWLREHYRLTRKNGLACAHPHRKIQYSTLMHKKKKLALLHLLHPSGGSGYNVIWVEGLTYCRAYVLTHINDKTDGVTRCLP